jgi:adenylate kinase
VADAAENPENAENGRRLKVVLLGPPGAGKGTQAQLLSARLGVPAISTGDMLREAVTAGSELGRRVEGIMAAGKLVDDELMAEVVRDRLAKPDAAAGYLLDGYPRTLPQAKTLEGILDESGQQLDAVVMVDVPVDELVRRSLLRGRADDAEEVIRERQRVYREKTEPLIGYYRQLGVLREIDGYLPVDEVTSHMFAALGLGEDIA